MTRELGERVNDTSAPVGAGIDEFPIAGGFVVADGDSADVVTMPIDKARIENGVYQTASHFRSSAPAA